MSEWCQNKKCPEKQNQNQIRGSKGAKYYQSNKSSGYYKYWCSMGCRDQWWEQHRDACIQAIGFIDKQKVPIEDAWTVRTQYDYNSTDGSYRVWRLENKLLGVLHSITREQALPEHSTSDWHTISNTEARELATTLGLSS